MKIDSHGLNIISHKSVFYHNLLLTEPSKTKTLLDIALRIRYDNIVMTNKTKPADGKAAKSIIGEPHSSKMLLLECAASEFLKKGWAKSSMREISKQAGVTTGSLYFHYRNKAALFDALVKDVYDSLLQNHRQMYETFFALPFDKKKMRKFRFEGRKRVIDFIYQNYRVVKLLVCCSEGSRYSDFFTLMMEDTHKADVRALSSVESCGGFLQKDIDFRLYSAIDKSFWTCLFETVKLDIPYEQALKYVAMLDDFYETGWQKILLHPNDYGISKP